MFDVIGSGEGWQVRKNGRPVGNVYKTEERAFALINRLTRDEKLSERPCITCRTVFKSEGPHHRMCRPCRQLATGMLAI